MKYSTSGRRPRSWPRWGGGRGGSSGAAWSGSRASPGPRSWWDRRGGCATASPADWPPTPAQSPAQTPSPQTRWRRWGSSLWKCENKMQITKQHKAKMLRIRHYILIRIRIKKCGPWLSSLIKGHLEPLRQTLWDLDYSHMELIGTGEEM